MAAIGVTVAAAVAAKIAKEGIKAATRYFATQVSPDGLTVAKIPPEANYVAQTTFNKGIESGAINRPGTVIVTPNDTPPTAAPAA